jgi:tetratricopeptide (TPR) repeat protein
VRGVPLLGPVTCSACGAKVREDRARCLRCGAALVAAAPPSRHLSPRVIGIVAGLIAIAALATYIAARRPETAAPAVQPAAPVAAPVAAATPAPAAAPVVPGQQTLDPAVASMDASRAGMVAYNGGNVAGSIEQFTAAVEANPDSADALNNLGQALVRAGRTSEAIPYFDRAIAAADRVWAYHFNRARAYAEMKQWGRAVAGYRDASRLFPNDYVTVFNLAKALQASGDLPGAIAQFERAISLAPGESDFHLAHAFALESAQRPRDAAAAYRRYLELEESAPQAEKIKARITQLETQS